jgi:hypothetical protein
MGQEHDSHVLQKFAVDALDAVDPPPEILSFKSERDEVERVGRWITERANGRRRPAASVGSGAVRASGLRSPVATVPR